MPSNQEAVLISYCGGGKVLVSGSQAPAVSEGTGYNGWFTCSRLDPCALTTPSGDPGGVKNRF